MSQEPVEARKRVLRAAARALPKQGLEFGEVLLHRESSQICWKRMNGMRKLITFENASIPVHMRSGRCRTKVRDLLG